MEETEVAGISLVSVFNNELFQTLESIAWLASTQVTNNGQNVTDTDKFVTMSLLYLFEKATKELKGFHSS